MESPNFSYHLRLLRLIKTAVIIATISKRGTMTASLFQGTAGAAETLSVKGILTPVKTLNCRRSKSWATMDKLVAFRPAVLGRAMILTFRFSPTSIRKSSG